MATDNFVPEIWAAALLQRFAAQAVLVPTMNRDYEGDATRGNTVHITQITTPTVQDYSVSRTHTNDALADTNVDLLIDQEKAIAFLVDDVDRVQAAGSFEPVTRDSAAALVEDAESFLSGQMLAEGTSTNAATPRSVTDGDTAYTEVLGIRTELSKQKTPAGNRFLAVNPEYSEFLLGANSRLSSVDTSGNSDGLRNAIIGRLLGFTVVETPLVNPGTPTAIGYHMQAVSYVNQIDRVETLRHQTSFSDIVRMLHVYGGKVTRPLSCQYFISGVS